MLAHLDSNQQEAQRKQPVIEPLLSQERADAGNYEGLREQLEKMLKVKSPISPNTAPKPLKSPPGQAPTGK
jgi:hypothetical protein